MSTVLLGVTGSIAAYKAADIVRKLQKAGHEVNVIMTPSATKFIGKITMSTLSKNPVAVGMFDEDLEWVPEHISLADKADLFLIAPCTANVIAKLANGIADDLLTCTALACAAPVLIAPAMNDRMWSHPATVANVSTLTERGVRFVDVGEGDLACGYEAKGRMAEPESIVDIANTILSE